MRIWQVATTGRLIPSHGVPASVYQDSGGGPSSCAFGARSAAAPSVIPTRIKQFLLVSRGGQSRAHSVLARRNLSPTAGRAASSARDFSPLARGAVVAFYFPRLAAAAQPATAQKNPLYYCGFFASVPQLLRIFHHFVDFGFCRPRRSYGGRSPLPRFPCKCSLS